MSIFSLMWGLQRSDLKPVHPGQKLAQVLKGVFHAHLHQFRLPYVQDAQQKQEAHAGHDPDAPLSLRDDDGVAVVKVISQQFFPYGTAHVPFESQEVLAIARLFLAILHIG